MLIVSSTLVVKSEFRDVALDLAQKHVAASLEEPGCISHAVYIHPIFVNDFFFFERWRDDLGVQFIFA
jgi:quinol monooxygenase YgiN